MTKRPVPSQASGGRIANHYISSGDRLAGM